MFPIMRAIDETISGYIQISYVGTRRYNCNAAMNCWLESTNGRHARLGHYMSAYLGMPQPRYVTYLGMPQPTTIRPSLRNTGSVSVPCCPVPRYMNLLTPDPSWVSYWANECYMLHLNSNQKPSIYSIILYQHTSDTERESSISWYVLG